MADSTNLKSMIESETSKNNVAPVEQRRKNVGGGSGRRKLTPHPLNPTPNESTSEVQVSDIWLYLSFRAITYQGFIDSP